MVFIVFACVTRTKLASNELVLLYNFTNEQDKFHRVDDYRLRRHCSSRHAQLCDTVRIRGLSVHKNVTDKARDIDITYNGWRPESGNLGPVQQRLQGFGRIKGLVVVTHGEFSPDLINLIEQLSKQGASSRHRDMGFDNVNETMSTVKQQVFLSLGIEAARDTTRMRIDKFGVALDVNVSNNLGAARRRRSKERFRQQVEAYEYRHCFFDIWFREGGTRPTSRGVTARGLVICCLHSYNCSKNNQTIHNHPQLLDTILMRYCRGKIFR